MDDLNQLLSITIDIIIIINHISFPLCTYARFMPDFKCALRISLVVGPISGQKDTGTQPSPTPTPTVDPPMPPPIGKPFRFIQ